MATGAYDSNGIWKYGEDDNISLFSTTLNKLADSISTAETADRARLATLEAGSLAGLIPVKAATITAATGTAAVSDLGTVTFSGITSLTLDGIFTSKYRNYRIIGASQQSASCDVQTKMRVAGADGSGSYYERGWYYQSAGISAYDRPAVPNHELIWSAAGERGFFVMDLLDVTIAEYTRLMSKSWSGIAVDMQGVNAAAIAMDGIYFSATSGTMTGHLQVFGYNH